jgi:chromosome segregation ATPase
MLRQMADVLDEQASELYGSAAAFEEEEAMLSREISERQTEINRLNSKLEALRIERDRVLERIDSLRREASAMRDEILDNEEEIALSAIDCNLESSIGEQSNGIQTGDRAPHGPVYFRRMTPAEHIR